MDSLGARLPVCSWFAGATLLVAAVFGCMGGYQEAVQAPAAPQAANRAEGMVLGSASYRERIALPPDAVLEVWIADTSPTIVAQVLLAETTLATHGRQVPIAFAVRYDPARAYADHSYGLKAVLKRGSEVLFTNEQALPVITQGHPTQVNLVLTRPGGPSGGAAGGELQGTWRLEDLAGAGVMDRVEATLEFTDEGKVAGNGSCNQFFGTVEVSGTSIRFGALGSTRKACLEAVMNQESKYLQALEGAERFTREGSELLIYCAGLEKPLRFVRKAP